MSQTPALTNLNGCSLRRREKKRRGEERRGEERNVWLCAMKFLFSGAAVKEQKCFGDALLQGGRLLSDIVVVGVVCSRRRCLWSQGTAAVKFDVHAEINMETLTTSSTELLQPGPADVEYVVSEDLNDLADADVQLTVRRIHSGTSFVVVVVVVLSQKNHLQLLLLNVWGVVAALVENDPEQESLGICIVGAVLVLGSFARWRFTWQSMKLDVATLDSWAADC